ncbi:MAG: hypothetical protein JWM11_5454 [Planctomycetaceae bacterium]|nr:hypothetical protein [Planctomycetaceae bacterium]
MTVKIHLCPPISKPQRVAEAKTSVPMTAWIFSFPILVAQTTAQIESSEAQPMGQVLHRCEHGCSRRIEGWSRDGPGHSRQLEC